MIPRFLRKIIVGAVLVVVAGAASFYGGFTYAEKRAAEKHVVELQKQATRFQEQLGAEILRSRAANEEIQAKLTAQVQTQTKASSAAINSLKNQLAKYKELPYAASCPDPGSYRLDVGTLGLLNAAINPDLPAIPATSGSDEKVATPSNVGIEKLVDYNLRVVNQYKELAIRHDSLVDYIQAWLKERAKKN